MENNLVDRRTALIRGVAAIAGLGLAACTPGSRIGAGPAPARVRATLPAVDVDEHRLIRTVAGLRPFRQTGFRLEPEMLGEKLVIHNYGHGGAGVTLSWGTARLAVEHALESQHRSAAVIGCGAVGLATARLLQDHGFRVRIYARDVPPQTTSNMAGALWAPFSVSGGSQRGTPFAQLLARASRYSHRYFQGLVGPRYGVRWLPLYMLSAGGQPTLAWTWELTPELFNPVRLEPDEHPFPHAGAMRTYSMMIEPETYLRAVLADFRAAGGELTVTELADPAAVAALDEPVIVNCTGLGARALFGDRTLIPARGQLAFLVPQPEIEYMYLAGESHMFPRSDGILLGGTFESGNWSTEPDPGTTARILEGNRRIAEHVRNDRFLSPVPHPDRVSLRSSW